MSLEPGTTLGTYSVTAKIGEGGMGEVYQARDTKLDRDVALKVLPEAFTSDPDRLARFEREAKVLASLNHPNIGSIYGLEEAEDVRALVLELIEGPTLADRIKQGPIPLDEALPIAKQIAEALEAAHEQGVIHRDLKPANIKVKDDGTVKVLDFGLAKAFQPEASDPNLSMSPTISLTAAATQMGMVIGTAAYMSPEQARGKVVDKRADVWAFGAVLFEMLAGATPFAGGDVSEVLATVIKTDPDWDVLPDETPPRVGTLLRRCLEKDPKQRVHDMADVRLAMAGAFETVAPALVTRRQVGGWRWVATAGLLAVAGLAAVATWALNSDTTPQRRPRYAEPGYLLFAQDGNIRAQRFDNESLQLQGDVHIVAADASFGGDSSVSANGMLAYHAGAQTGFSQLWYDLYLKPTTRQGEAELLFSDEGDIEPSDWSYDGRFVLFDWRGGDIWVFSMQDRTASPLLEGPYRETDGRFSPDGQWITYVSDETGELEVYVRPFPGPGRELFFLAPDRSLMSVEIRLGPQEQVGLPQLLFATGIKGGHGQPRAGAVTPRIYVNVG